MTLEALNALPDNGFIETLGGIYEHSPWVAETVVSQRPFADLQALEAAMRDAVASAPHIAKLHLLRAHPELAGKAAIDGTLTEASEEEQASAGLDRMLPDEFEAMTQMNAAYQEKFGFPFIICVKQTTKAGILAAMESRLENGQAEEFATALGEVDEIARLRLDSLID